MVMVMEVTCECEAPDTWPVIVPEAPKRLRITIKKKAASYKYKNKHKKAANWSSMIFKLGHKSHWYKYYLYTN